ncbi:MAG: NAD(P)-dependent oxidoreductase [Segniliparus sp.]|uniref:NAD(P)-dependent oxidoreductase n=1 Tax=Segniliparus sp. TaxID=2804064 RepID=UPI003F3AF58D
MAKVVVFGATGYAGGHIVDELLGRGHEVTGVARLVDKIQLRDRLAAAQGSALDERFVAETVAGADVVVSALPTAAPGSGPELAESLAVLLKAAEQGGARLGVVGGAGSLRVAPGGPTLLDGDFPEEVRPIAEEHGRALDFLQAAQTGADWFYLSPAANFGSWTPGERTGAFRLGDDVLLVDETGESRISGADYAIAFVDEIERPAHHKARFTVGY